MPESGIIQLNCQLSYFHYGAQNVTSFDDNPLNPPVNLDERAKVYLINRNIRIQGDGDWGCNVFLSSVKVGSQIFASQTNISHTEFVNCGQTDTNFATINIVQNNQKSSYTYLEGISLHDLSYSGIILDSSININISNSIITSPQKWGINARASLNTIINNTHVVNLKNRIFPAQSSVNELIDLNACFYTCIENEASVPCSVLLNATHCAGSEFFGYVTNGQTCDYDYTKDTNYRSVTAAQYGFYAHNSKALSCFKSGNVIAYNNYKLGYGFLYKCKCNSS